MLDHFEQRIRLLHVVNDVFCAKIRVPRVFAVGLTQVEALDVGGVSVKADHSADVHVMMTHNMSDIPDRIFYDRRNILCTLLYIDIGRSHDFRVVCERGRRVP